MKFRLLFFLSLLSWSMLPLLAQEKRGAKEVIVTIQEYCQFLNENASSASDHFYEQIGRGQQAEGCQILRLGTQANYHYELDFATSATAPMLFLSQHDAACYCDWKNASQNREDGTLVPISSSGSTIDPYLKSNLVTFHCVPSDTSCYQMNGPEVMAASEEEGYLVGLLVSIFVEPALGRETSHQLRNSRSISLRASGVEETNIFEQYSTRGTSLSLLDHSFVEQRVSSVPELPQESLSDYSSGGGDIQYVHKPAQRTQLTLHGADAATIPREPSLRTTPNKPWIEKLGFHDLNLFGLYIKTTYLKSLDLPIKAACQKIFNKYKEHYRRELPLPAHLFAASSWEQLVEQDQEQLKQLFLKYPNLLINAEWEAKFGQGLSALHQSLMMLEAGSYYEAKVMSRILKEHQERGSHGQGKLLRQEIPQAIRKINLKLEKFKKEAEVFSSFFQKEAELKALAQQEIGTITERFRAHIEQAQESLKQSKNIFGALAKKQLNNALEEKRKEQFPFSEEEEQVLREVAAPIQKEADDLSTDDLYCYGMRLRDKYLEQYGKAMSLECNYRAEHAGEIRKAQPLEEASRLAGRASQAFEEAVTLRAQGSEYQRAAQAKEQEGQCKLIAAKIWANGKGKEKIYNFEHAAVEAWQASNAFERAALLRTQRQDPQEIAKREQEGNFYLERAHLYATQGKAAEKTFPFDDYFQARKK